jgi:hypothetical protein
VAGDSAYLHGVAFMRSLIVLGCVGAAWLLGSFWPKAWLDWIAPDPLIPKLPLVSAPYAHRSDVISLVPDLYSALFLATICLLLLEAPKLLIANSQGSARTIPLLSLLAVQQGLFIDVLRRCAPDWYGYGLHYLRLVELSHYRPRPEVLPIPAPWYSLFFVGLCMIVLLRQKVRSSLGAQGT